MKYIPKIFLFLIVCLQVTAAQITFTLPELIVNEGDTVNVPVIVSGFNNIGAISLAIRYNASVLDFIEFTNKPENLLCNAIPGTIYAAYARLLPFSFSQDTLFVIKFRHLGGNSTLIFSGESETADINAAVLPVTYVAGKVTDALYQTSSLGDRVWIDTNKNGLQDAGEKGLQWVTVELFSCNNSWLGYTLTDSAGSYSFDSLYEGDYFLQFSLIDNNAKYSFTSYHQGNDTLIDSDAETLNDSVARTTCVHVFSGISVFDMDAGVQTAANDNPSDYYLAQNYPNPFNPSTTINFTLPQKEFVTLIVYNLLGERIKVLLSEEKDKGSYSAEFNAAGLGSGVYFYTLRTSSKILTRKMVLER